MTTVNTLYKYTGLTGGAATDLDSVDGDSLVNGDFAFVFASGILYQYELDSTSGATEASPFVIAPDSNPGTKRWLLFHIFGAGAHGSITTKTIASGIVTVSGPGCYAIDTESAAASDALDKIVGLAEGEEVIIKPADDTHSVVVTSGTYMKIQANFTMDNQYDSMRLLCLGSDVCIELSRANNGS